MKLSEKRNFPKGAISYNICKRCADGEFEYRKVCCLQGPCTYWITDFDVFNESILKALLAKEYATIFYRNSKYVLRARTDEDTPGKYLSEVTDFDKMGICVHLNYHYEQINGENKTVSDGCSLSEQVRPGGAINFIAAEPPNKCYLNKDHLQKKPCTYDEFHQVIVNVLLENDEIWKSPYTGKTVFHAPYGKDSHGWFYNQTIKYFHSLLKHWQKKIRPHSDFNEMFYYPVTGKIKFIDYNEHRIFNLYFVPEDGLIEDSGVDFILLKNLLGYEININTGNIQRGLDESMHLKFDIAITFEKAYHLINHANSQ